MINDRRTAWKGIFVYLLLTFTFSSVFYAIIISIGRLGAGNGRYVYGIMWCPGLAALLTCALTKRKISDLGWKWGRTRYQFWAYLIPLLYTLIAYVFIWVTRMGGFYNKNVVTAIGKAFGWESFSPGLIILFFFLITGTYGMITSSASALGEEIGWRGFFLPQLVKVTSFPAASLISGLIWAVWHFPLLLFADYNSGTPAWYGLLCFTALVIGTSFIYAYLRLKSGSLWTAVFLHASHNLFIQQIFTPLTSDTGKTKWIMDEFGAALAVMGIIAAAIFWPLGIRLLKRQYNQKQS